ncbi:homeobox-DDT domain protein RLT1-like isoform X1 [Actinidia eriantha]|uniref:homeobox-DDT domain protein RLT1-like isoform X1 n=1 Tax=Actinidia eriantha TaxID=165200 RepID=UPI00258976C2|nr:homeobox-DDT domain protein RLT1-like isoform X1 [Actinidia eriantha]
MEAVSEGENNKNSDESPIEEPKKPKRQMKTPYQLEILEKTYAMETYPLEATRAELSEKLGLSDRQLQMWFCHRRLKEKKDLGAKKTKHAGGVEKKGLFDPARDELMAAERGSNHGSRSGSGSESGSGWSRFDERDDVPMVRRYYESTGSVMEKRVIACVEAQLGEPLREDGPILGMDFDELPPGAFGEPIVMTKQSDQSGLFSEGKSFRQCDSKSIKAATRGHREYLLDEPKIRSDVYERLIPSNFYDQPVECPSASAPLLLHHNGQLSRGYGIQGQASCPSLSSQQSKQGLFSSPSGDNNCIPQWESLINMPMGAPDNSQPAGVPDNIDASDRHISNSESGLRIEKKRKSNEARIGSQVDAHEKRIRKELEQQDILRRKREEQMRREMEKQDRERRKDEERMVREKQRQQERFEREERRENERREKFLQKESLKAERRRQKEELRREKEEARLKAAIERATTRRIARESMELIEDERLELMELAASSKGLPSIISLDYDTLQNLESFRGFLYSFPPKSVQLKRPFSVQPWTDSEENIGNLLMVWRSCITFADVLGLWPFTLDEFVQAFHDYDSRLLGEIHISLLKLIIKDIEEGARTLSNGIGTNQCSSANPEGGHPQIVEGAYVWGFDIRNWKNHLNPLTWPEILRQFALSAAFGPQLKKKSIKRAGFPDNDETKGCQDIISTLRNGAAAENAVAIMQEKGFPLQRRSRHRLTPGTVKFAAYHVLSLEGSKGMNVMELAHKIQKSGLRDLTTSKTPEASISVALSRDAVLFERTAPSTYRVRPPFRKDPADADAILSAAREKIKRYENGFLAGEIVDDVERDEHSEAEGAEGPEIYGLGTPNANRNSNNGNEVGICSGNGKECFLDDVTQNLQNEPDAAGTLVNQFVDISCKDNGSNNLNQGDPEIDEGDSGEPWVQGLAEGEYSDLSVEERLKALVTLVGICNEGNSIRSVLEDRLDAANALKKQMLAEAQLDKKRIKEESFPKCNTSFMGIEAETKQTCAAADSSQSPLTAVDNKIRESPLETKVNEEPSVEAENLQEHHNPLPADRMPVEPEASMGQIGSSIQQNGYTAERSRMQLKSYIGHRAEEMYIYRSLPLGQDRRRNRYWQFVASASSNDPGSGRIFVESPDGCWRLIDSEKAFDALLESLDTRGIRESHLHIMLQNIEKSFKETIRRNSQCAIITDRSGNIGREDAEMDCSPAHSGGDDSPSSTVSGSNTNTCEPSFSFGIELGKSETEKKASMERYQEFQKWMWKECFNSSTLCAMKYGEKRCRPLLEICDFCLDSYKVVNNLCPSCYRSFGDFDDQITLSELCEDKRKASPRNSNSSKFSHPSRIRLLRAILTTIEASVPSEALQSSWLEKCRNTWGIKLHSMSAEDLLQILTEFEAAIKRAYLSTNFETTEELLASSALSGRVACDSANPGSVLELPWIPQTTAAVGLRLLELDGSISYSPHQKVELLDNNELEGLTKLQSRYTFMMNIEDTEQGKHRKEKNSTDLASMHEIYGYRQKGICGRGRGRGRPQKRFVGSGRQNLSMSSSQVLRQQGQRLSRGRRTVRRRRIEESAVPETLLGHLGNTGGLKILDILPRNSSGEEEENCGGEEIRQMQIEDAGKRNGLEAVESDADDQIVEYEYEKWGTGNAMVMSDEDVDASEDENGFEEIGEENFGVDVDMNEDSDGNGDGNENGSTDPSDSEDFSD